MKKYQKSKRPSSLFVRLKKGLEDFLEHLQGKRSLKMIVIGNAPYPSADEIAALRSALDMSMRTFAELLNVSVATVHKWDTGRHTPRGPGLRLLQLLRKNPKESCSQLFWAAHTRTVYPAKHVA